MSTAVQAPIRGYTPPSRTELAEEIRHYAPAMHLYQGSPEWVTIEVHGRLVHFPPDLGGTLVDHPTKRDAAGGPARVPADGRIAVRDVYGILRDPRNANRPYGIGLLPGQESSAIVMYLVENYQERGIVWLRGDETDQVRIDASKKLYSRFIRGWAEEQRGARAEFVRNFQDKPQNKGLVPPPPTPPQIRAQEILDSISIEGRQGHEFMCTVCYGWEGASFETYARHMKASHGRVVEKPKDEGAENVGRARAIRGDELAELENPAPVEGAAAAGPANTVIPGSGMSMAPTDSRAGGVPVDHDSPARNRRKR